MLRAYLHMVEQNMHRVRVANSVEILVNSVADPQLRDLVLAKLVEAIIHFGESGLLRHEPEDADFDSLSADILGRIIAAAGAKR